MQKLSRTCLRVARRQVMQGGGVRSVVFSLLFSLFFIAVSVSAATTISGNISTDGTLSVTGASTLTGLTTVGYASSTGISLTRNLTASGIVGVGTTTPGRTLAVHGNALVSGTGYFGGAVTATSTLTVTGLTTLGYASTTGISLTDNLTALGVVGVGTTTPGRTLAVHGNALVSGTGYFGGAVIATSTLAVDGNTTLGDAQGDILTVNAGTITHGNAATTTIPAANLGAWAIATSSAVVPFVRFDTSTYRVGIGTTSPGRTLSVSGDAVFRGNVNVEGTFSPTQTSATSFTVDTTLTVTGRSDLNGQASTTRLSAFDRVYVGGTSTTTIVGGSAASTIPYASSTSITVTESTFLATAGGSVGVGTTTPARTFSVQGGALVSGPTTIGGAVIATSTVEVTGQLTANGDVGLSTSTPAQRLSVQGSAFVSGTVTGGSLTATSTLTVGLGNTGHTGFLSGTCNIAQRALVASTTGGFQCSSATGVTTSFKVFVSATTTLAGHLTSPSNGFAIVAASSTAADTIGVELSNLTGAANTPAGTLNFWAIK